MAPVHVLLSGPGALPIRSALPKRSGRMEITLDREQAMKAVSVAKTFAAGASGLKVLVRPEVAFDE